MIKKKAHDPSRSLAQLLWAVILLSCTGFSIAACRATTTERLGLPPLTTVNHVDLSRYTGVWYEIASYPHRFQKGCTGTMATYTPKEDGEIGVVNRCRSGSLDGEEQRAEGRARVVDRTTNAKLEVSFFRPFWGDYWIIDLDEHYNYAVVGHPGRDYLWILSRTPTMEEQVYSGILARLRAKSYPLEPLRKTLQPSERPTSR